VTTVDSVPIVIVSPTLNPAVLTTGMVVSVVFVPGARTNVESWPGICA
jgi:2-keto-3-deoxy-6-phosphogluconate aldolase